MNILQINRARQRDERDGQQVGSSSVYVALLASRTSRITAHTRWHC